MFREWLFEQELSNRLANEFDNLEYYLATNVEKLWPLHLVEAKAPEKMRHPKYSLIGAGDSNPKTAKHPDTDETYMGAVLHLEPYVASGHQTCPFATAIYKIATKGLDRETMKLVKSAPGYTKKGKNHTFYGFEIRLRNFAQMGQMMTKNLVDAPHLQACNQLMQIRLPGENLRDWESGPTIKLDISKITKTELVGGCANACLHTAGNPAFGREKLGGRRRKTLMLKTEKMKFLSKVLMDLFRLTHAANTQKHSPVIRLNATSDEFWESDDFRFPDDPDLINEVLKEQWPSRTTGKLKNHISSRIGGSGKSFGDVKSNMAEFIAGKTLLEIFPHIQFYDYTKSPSRMMKFLRANNSNDFTHWPKNYYLTFSLAEGNRSIAKKVLANGGTVAVVFNVQKNPQVEGKLPQTWAGYPVTDGDKHDFRFLDNRGHVVGLRAKGEAKFATTDFGFVIQPDDPDLDPNDPAVQTAQNYSSKFEKDVESGRLAQPGFRKQRMKQAGKQIGLPTIY